MTFALLVYDLKNHPADIHTTEVREYPAETITRTSKQYPDDTHTVVVKENQTDIHAKIKEAMLAKGYTDKAHTTKSYLPHNCLIKDNISQQQAINDLIEVVKKYDAALKRYAAFTITGRYQADASLL